MLAFLLTLWSLPAPEARADDPAPAGTDNAIITLSNRIETFVTNGNIPDTGNYRIDISIQPPTGGILTESAGAMPVGGSKGAVMPGTSGKLMVAGGLGKRILTVSAQMYDKETRDWLTKGNFAIGGGKRFSAISFGSRVLVWIGLIMPF